MVLKLPPDTWAHSIQATVLPSQRSHAYLWTFRKVTGLLLPNIFVWPTLFQGFAHIFSSQMSLDQPHEKLPAPHTP